MTIQQTVTATTEVDYVDVTYLVGDSDGADIQLSSLSPSSYKLQFGVGLTVALDRQAVLALARELVTNTWVVEAVYPTAATDASALDQIAGILGLYTTDPGNNPVSEVIADIVGYVKQTGRATDTPEGA